MAIYVKLGPKASGFFDPVSQVSIVGKEVKELTRDQLKSSRTASALRGQHLTRATKADFLSFQKKLSETIKSEGGKTLSTTGAESTMITELKKIIKTQNENIAELQGQVSKLTQDLDVAKHGTEEPEEEEEEMVDFDEMDGEELTKYYEENFEVNKTQVKAFDKLSEDKKREKLEELETTE